jgi:HrpA-like RNA helicase
MVACSAKILYIEGRQYPVDIYCTAEPQTDYLDAALVTIFQIHSDYPLGDILVFLSGQEEIESLERLLNECARELPPTAAKLLVCPLFANLPSHQQAEVFDRTPKNCRKVVLATNLAETSITISGVRFVIDTGVHKCRGYHPRTGIETLTVQPISKASARQRLGRAGRESKGFCFRLYTETAFQQLAEDEEPEIKRCSLSSIVLLLKGAGINDVVGFDYFDRPFRESRKFALLYVVKLNYTYKHSAECIGRIVYAGCPG